MGETFTTERSYRITVGRDSEGEASVTERLRQFNLEQVPALSLEGELVPVEIYVRDEVETVVGGLIGKTIWGWLDISVIWVDEALRRQGIGRELMRMAEEEGVRRGCVHARLNTWDFQAPGFYERLGYVPYGRLDDYPEGHTVHYMRKALGDEPSA